MYKHTPELFYNWQRTSSPVKRHNRISIVDGGGCHIADISCISFETYSLEEKEKHAHVIAAAPELLKAGKRLDRAIAAFLSDAGGDSEDKKGLQIRHDEYCAALKEVQDAQTEWNAALTKAKGEA